MTLCRFIVVFTLLAVGSGEDGRVGPSPNCSHGRDPWEGDVLLDKAIKRWLTSESFHTVAIPTTRHTSSMAGFKVTVDVYNGTISGLSGVKRLGSNYIDARRNDSFRLRFGVEVDGLNVSLSLKIRVFYMDIYVHAEIFVPATTFVIEIEQIDENLDITHFNVNNTKAFDFRFRLVGWGTYFFNKLKWPLQVYLRRRINRTWRTELLRALRQQLKDISRLRRGNLNGTDCANCTMLDAAFSYALLKYHLEPAPLPASTSNMFGSLLATLVNVKVSNATVEGLSKTRQVGDVVVRVDQCGAFAFLDLKLHNLTAKFALLVSSWFVDFTAIVAASVSARVIMKFVEKNETLVLEQLVVNMTEPLNITVTPISAVASMASMFLPTKVIGNLLTAQLPSLVNVTIQNGLNSLHKYAHGE